MEKIIINNLQNQIILGSLLGSGFICYRGDKKPYFCMRHSNKHHKWLMSKAYELRFLSTNKSFCQNSYSCTWRTSCNEAFRYYYDLFYKNKEKNVSLEILDQLRDIGIAVWYGDSGKLLGRNWKNSSISTQKFGLEGNQIISNYFNDVGLENRITKIQNKQKITFTVKGSEKLIEMVAVCLPPNRNYKIIPKSLLEN